MDYFTRSHVEQIDRGLLVFSVNERYIQGYLQAFAAAALIYDSILTMDREVKYFWKVPRKAVDLVYFANRYTGIFGAVAYLSLFSLSAGVKECKRYCNFAQWTRDTADWLTVILTDYVLMIRVLALYSRDRTLTICLYLLLALETTVKLAMIVYIDVFEKVALGGSSDVTMCGTDRIAPWQLGIVDWSIPIAYGVVLMLLALYKAAEYWRLSSGFKGLVLVKVLIEDQVVYFMAVILVSVFAMLEFRLDTSKETVSYVLNLLGNVSFLCILGSRMLLNLKEAGERGQNEGTSMIIPSRTVSDIEFGEPPANLEATQIDEAFGE